MKKLFATAALLTASWAYGVGMGVGGFGGIALPMGDTADDFEMSPKFGGKVLIGVLPALELEAGFAYHINHPYKDWEGAGGTEEPKTTVIPITFGANYKLSFGSAGIHFGGGGGFYLAKMGFSQTVVIPPVGPLTATGDYSVNKPGFFFGGGFLYSFGNLALDVSPRFHYFLSEGDYDVDYKVKYRGQEYAGTTTEHKNYNDTWVDLLFGVDYFFM